MIETERLILRHWKKRDRAAFAALNADPMVMRFMGPPLSSEESNDNRERMEAWDRQTGLSFWPVIRKQDGAFLGMCGLKPLTVAWPQAGDIEIGWRFARAFWGCGYAREAAEACLLLGLSRFSRVIAMTVPDNQPSRRLMQRLGMVRAPELDFDHPNMTDGNRLQWQIVHVKAR